MFLCFVYFLGEIGPKIILNICDCFRWPADILVLLSHAVCIQCCWVRLLREHWRAFLPIEIRTQKWKHHVRISMVQPSPVQVKHRHGIQRHKKINVLFSFFSSFFIIFPAFKGSFCVPLFVLQPFRTARVCADPRLQSCFLCLIKFMRIRRRKKIHQISLLFAAHKQMRLFYWSVFPVCIEYSLTFFSNRFPIS